MREENKDVLLDAGAPLKACMCLQMDVGVYKLDNFFLLFFSFSSFCAFTSADS